jgi:hypothetical protein
VVRKRGYGVSFPREGGSSRRQPRGLRIVKIISRAAVACLALLTILALASIASGALAQTPGKSLKDQLVGHWRLVSVSVNGATPYGDSPEGTMFLDATGHYAVIVLTAGRARNIAYFGTYTVNDADSSVTMQIEAGGNGVAARPDEKRFVAFSGDELTMETRRPGGPAGGVKLTWKLDN